MAKVSIKKEFVKNKAIFNILIFVSTIVHLSTINLVYSQSNSEKYYRYVILNNRNEIKGKYLIDELLAKNIHSYRFIYNEDSILILIENLNINSTNPFPVRDFRNNYVSEEVWNQLKIEYNDNIEKRTYINKIGEVYAYEIIEKDELQNTMTQSNYFSDGFLQNQYKWSLNINGQIIKESWIDYQVGIGNYTMELNYSNNDLRIVKKNIGEFDNLETHHYWGYAISQSNYDEYGNEIEIKYYGTDFKLIRLEYGYSSIQIDYDKNGNLVEKRYYGIDNNLIGYRNRKGMGGGYSITRYKYDEKGNLLEQSFYDTNNKLMESLETGIAIYQFKYDMNCRLIEKRFYGADGNLKEYVDDITKNKSGYSIIKFKYDKYGREIERSYYGADEKLCLKNFGEYSINRTKYNDVGNVLEESYYGIDSNLKNVKYDYGYGFSGYAIIQYRYNELGKLIESNFFNADGINIRSDIY